MWLTLKIDAPLDFNVIKETRYSEALLVPAIVAFKAPAKSSGLDEFFSRN